MSEIPRQRELRQCLRKLGVPAVGDDFNWSRLDQALTHASASADSNYEHLEFLGDSVLRLAAAEFLMETYPRLSVGEMAAIRSRLVSDQTLADWADALGIEPYLHLSAAALRDRTGRRSRLADAFEAVLGVLYLERQDLSLVRPWLDALMERLTQHIRQDPTLQNYKAALQELTQGVCGLRPEYRTEEISQIHGDLERFASTVWFQQRHWGYGRGPSMKEAEQAAARMAYGPLMQALQNPEPAQ